MEAKLVIDRFEGSKTVLKTESGNDEIIYPKDLLPPDVHEGSILKFQVLTAAEAEEEKRKKAKDILNEILNTEGGE